MSDISSFSLIVFSGTGNILPADKTSHNFDLPAVEHRIEWRLIIVVE